MNEVGVPSSSVEDEPEVGRIFREEFGRSVAPLVRVFGDIDVAEDAVQEAFTVALEAWARDGLPPNPGGWITTTARHRAIDRLRRDSRRKELLRMATNGEGADPGPDDDEHAVHDERLRPVLAVVYLIYNAGHSPEGGMDLCAEAIRLARVLATLMPDEPEVAGLLALLLLTESRRQTRINADGALVVLGEQDRTRWDRALIAEGRMIASRCLARGQLGPYQLQAAIADVHASAASVAATHWPQILTLYDQLLAQAPNPVVALNRAVALAEVEGPDAALTVIDDLPLDTYYPFHATKADLLRRLGRNTEAAASYNRAAELAPTRAEREFLTRRASAETLPSSGLEDNPNR